jgi:hypothetical protein
MEPAQGPPPKRRRRPLFRVALALLLIVLVGVSWLAYEWHRAERERREAEAEADRLDPGWRLTELEAARVIVPDEENSALQVRAAFKLLPAKWAQAAPNEIDLSAEIALLPPNERLSDDQRERLRSALGNATPALEKARRLAEMPRGRYRIAWSPDGIGRLVPHIHEAPEISRLLSLAAAAGADEGAIDDALEVCRAIVNVGRSFGDEPIVVSAVTRINCRRAAAHALERVLGQGEPREVALQKVQSLLEDEATRPLQLVGTRAERAAIHQCLRVIEAGEFNYAAYGLRKPEPGPAGLYERLERLRARACHAAYLRYLNECVEIAKLPPEQQAERLSRVERMRPTKVPTIIEALTRGDDYGHLARNFHRDLARLRCAIAGVAAERFRLENGHWPDRLEDLVPRYLSGVPSDPSDGRALRYRRTEDGVIVSTLVPAMRKGPGGHEQIELFDPEQRGRASPAKGTENTASKD